MSILLCIGAIPDKDKEDTLIDISSFDFDDFSGFNSFIGKNSNKSESTLFSIICFISIVKVLFGVYLDVKSITKLSY